MTPSLIRNAAARAVVGADAKRRRDAIGYAPYSTSKQLARVLDDRPQQVGLVVGELALHHRRDTLQAHAGVDRGTGQRSQDALGRAVELHEDEIPDLDEAAAAIVGKLLVLAAGLRCFRTVDRSGSPSTGRTGRSRPSARSCPSHRAGRCGLFGTPATFCHSSSASSSSRKTVTYSLSFGRP